MSTKLNSQVSIQYSLNTRAKYHPSVPTQFLYAFCIEELL